DPGDVGLAFLDVEAHVLAVLVGVAVGVVGGVLVGVADAAVVELRRWLAGLDVGLEAHATIGRTRREEVHLAVVGVVAGVVPGHHDAAVRLVHLQEGVELGAAGEPVVVDLDRRRPGDSIVGRTGDPDVGLRGPARGVVAVGGVERAVAGPARVVDVHGAEGGDAAVVGDRRLVGAGEAGEVVVVHLDRRGPGGAAVRRLRVPHPLVGAGGGAGERLPDDVHGAVLLHRDLAAEIDSAHRRRRQVDLRPAHAVVRREGELLVVGAVPAGVVAAVEGARQVVVDDVEVLVLEGPGGPGVLDDALLDPGGAAVGRARDDHRIEGRAAAAAEQHVVEEDLVVVVPVERRIGAEDGAGAGAQVEHVVRRRAGVVPRRAAVARVEDGLRLLAVAGRAGVAPGVGGGDHLVGVPVVDRDLDLAVEIVGRRHVGR